MPIFIVVPPGRKKKKNHQIKAKGKVFNIKSSGINDDKK